jgi:hypothetical protein
VLRALLSILARRSNGRRNMISPGNGTNKAGYASGAAAAAAMGPVVLMGDRMV